MLLNTKYYISDYKYYNLLWHILSILSKGIHLLHSSITNTIISNVTNTYTCFLNRSVIPNSLYVLTANTYIQAKLFTDLLIADFPNNILRFISITNITSIIYNIRIIVKALVPTNLVLQTITNIFTCSSWCERESWDLFGVFYNNNVDLRRILNDYGFHGHPLKKDFPLSGYSETLFSFTLGVVLYKLLKMIQELRFFNINSSWNYYLNKL